MNSIASRLRAFAKGRETAYRIHRRLTPEKVASITKILRHCEHFQRSKALGWVKGIVPDLLLILPHEESGMKGARGEILGIIEVVNAG